MKPMCWARGIAALSRPASSDRYRVCTVGDPNLYVNLFHESLGCRSRIAPSSLLTPLYSSLYV